MKLTESQVQTVLACSGFASEPPAPERDTWPAPPPDWFKPCGCVFPSVDPPPGQHWDHAPDCPHAGQ